MNQPGGGEPPPGGLQGEAEPAAYAGRKTTGGGVAVSTASATASTPSTGQAGPGAMEGNR